MRAVVFHQVGRPEEVLQIQEMPVPEPGPGEVRVRMIASPVNPSDLMYIAGQYGITPKLPATPGFEGVGIVEKAGTSVLGWLRKGKRVAVINDNRGNWSEYTITNARQVIPVPPDIKEDQAATFFVNPFTAVVLTQKILRIPRGAWLLQTAAGGALGRMIIRLGKEFGFRTLNLVRRPEHIDELKALGADAVWLESDGSVTDRVRKTLGDELLYAIDPVGGELAADVARSMGHGGHLVLYGSLSNQPLTIDPRRMLTQGTTIEGFWLGQWMKNQPVLKLLRLIRQVKGLMHRGILTTEKTQIYPLEQYREAVIAAASPGKAGKVILKIG